MTAVSRSTSGIYPHWWGDGTGVKAVQVRSPGEDRAPSEPRRGSGSRRVSGTEPPLGWLPEHVSTQGNPTGQPVWQLQERAQAARWPGHHGSETSSSARGSHATDSASTAHASRPVDIVSTLRDLQAADTGSSGRHTHGTGSASSRQSRATFDTSGSHRYAPQRTGSAQMAHAALEAHEAELTRRGRTEAAQHAHSAALLEHRESLSGTLMITQRRSSASSDSLLIRRSLLHA